MKLLATTILLLTAFTASADSDYQPESNAAPIYPPALEVGWIQLFDAENRHVLLYAPSITRVMETTPKKGDQLKTTIYMIDGTVTYVSDRIGRVQTLLKTTPPQ